MARSSMRRGNVLAGDNLQYRCLPSNHMQDRLHGPVLSKTTNVIMIANRQGVSDGPCMRVTPVQLGIDSCVALMVRECSFKVKLAFVHASPVSVAKM